MKQKVTIRSSLSFVALFALLAMLACSSNNSGESQVVEYNGVGLHQVNPQTTIISGTVKYKAYAGGEILVEIRRSVPCTYGHCPIIGEPALAQQKLDAPGPYSLQLPQSAKDLMVISTIFPPTGGVRIAHAWLASDFTEIPNVDLSLDRPYPPLR